MTPVASGFIAGESLMGVAIAMAIALRPAEGPHRPRVRRGPRSARRDSFEARVAGRATGVCVRCADSFGSRLAGRMH